MSLLIVPLLYPDLAGLLNFSQHPFQHNFRVADEPPAMGHPHRGIVVARAKPSVNYP